jgi:hypothetical protein
MRHEERNIVLALLRGKATEWSETIKRYMTKLISFLVVFWCKVSAAERTRPSEYKRHETDNTRVTAATTTQSQTNMKDQGIFSFWSHDSIGIDGFLDQDWRSYGDGKSTITRPERPRSSTLLTTAETPIETTSVGATTTETTRETTLPPSPGTTRPRATSTVDGDGIPKACKDGPTTRDTNAPAPAEKDRPKVGDQRDWRTATLETQSM